MSCRDWVECEGLLTVRRRSLQLPRRRTVRRSVFDCDRPVNPHPRRDQTVSGGRAAPVRARICSTNRLSALLPRMSLCRALSPAGVQQAEIGTRRWTKGVSQAETCKGPAWRRPEPNARPCRNSRSSPTVRPCRQPPSSTSRLPAEQAVAPIILAPTTARTGGSDPEQHHRVEGWDENVNVYDATPRPPHPQ